MKIRDIFLNLISPHCDDFITTYRRSRTISSIFISKEELRLVLYFFTLIKAYVSTFEGKNKAFLKSLSSIDSKNVPMNRIIDIRNTSGT